ncbi:nucleoside deaminase [[Acholeplasma] multilocale]|uniref:nucleoside deaminase n=1 Tax=[Acholeplasma] multilocale TaxID=264638 RepID=UPI0004253D2E|nr:nucleoside deaminase [[Acholeplasma] multilocale]
MKKEIYDLLIKKAVKATKHGDVPVAAVVLNAENEVVGVGYNTRNKKHNISCHAEINALNKTIKKVESLNLNGYKIITTLEPCEMCYGAIKQSKIKKIEYILKSSKFGISEIYSINDIDVIFKKVGTKKEENMYQDLLEKFFKDKRK